MRTSRRRRVLAACIDTREALTLIVSAKAVSYKLGTKLDIGILRKKLMFNTTAKVGVGVGETVGVNVGRRVGPVVGAGVGRVVGVVVTKVHT